MIDTLILFIASNAIYIAIGAVFSTISNEIFSFEMVEKIEKVKYNNKLAKIIRNKITKFSNTSVIIYCLNLIFTFITFFIKHIFNNYINTNFINIFEKFTIIIFIFSVSWLVINIILVLTSYFTLRNIHFREKKSKLASQ